MRNSFAFKLTLRVALLVTLTTIIVLATGGWLLKRQGIHSLEIMQQVEGEELAGLMGTETNLAPAQIKQRIETEADSDIALYFIQVRDARGETVYRSANLGGAFIPSAPDGQTTWSSSIVGVGAVRVSEFKSGEWRIQVGSALDPVTHVLEDYLWVAGVLVAASALVSLVIGYAFSRMTLAPVRSIESTARRIRADNLSERIPVPPGRDELVALTTLLNHTFDHLEKAFAQVRRFTADASHELKTPIALIRLGAEKLRARLENDPEADALLADLLVETDRMSGIIESLLFIAKVEGGALMLERRAKDMRVFLGEFIEDACALAEDRGLRFEMGRNDSGTAMIEPQIMRQLLLNLVSNAISASPAGSVITLDSERVADGWRLMMSDEGTGLPPEMLERVFERFTRHQTSSSGDGHGLGLAICRSIAELHGGAIRAENRAGRSGLCVVFEW